MIEVIYQILILSNINCKVSFFFYFYIFKLNYKNSLTRLKPLETRSNKKKKNAREVVGQNTIQTVKMFLYTDKVRIKYGPMSNALWVEDDTSR